jgi:hypothetical protein
MTIVKFPGRFASGNGTRPNQQNTLAGNPNDRKQNLKYAIFYLVAAIILFLANRVSTQPARNGNRSQPFSNLHLDLSVTRNVETSPVGNSAAGGGTFVVRFRLANQGNQPVFYPVFPGTNHPMGQVLYRFASGADWKLLSAGELSPPTPGPQNVKPHLAWVEMPPGGWAEGEYEDPGSPAGEHAFELEVKVAIDGNASPLRSRAYPVSTN